MVTQQFLLFNLKHLVLWDHNPSFITLSFQAPAETGPGLCFLQPPQLQPGGGPTQAAGLCWRLCGPAEAGLWCRRANGQQPIPHERFLWYDACTPEHFCSESQRLQLSSEFPPPLASWQAAWWWSWRRGWPSWRTGPMGKASSFRGLLERSALDPTSTLSERYPTHRYTAEKLAAGLFYI